MLSLILGVMAMHSTVACDAGTAQSQDMASHTGSPTAGLQPAPSVPSLQMSTAGLRSTMAQPAGMTADPGVLLLSTPAAVSHSAALLMTAGVLTSSDGHGGRSVLHDLLHLCMAVLSALTLLAAAALLAWFLGGRTGRSDSVRGVWQPAPGPRAPPPTSVRLAQLCVLRN
ncbi:MAG: hypothetical protein EKK42_34605 [Pseudonocardiaceae bacterium]|nr:MAG: hypothetical protein EKK42_34605 [Pseudonocardiaceae bacterium]